MVAGSLSNMSLVQVMLWSDISCQLLRYRVKAQQFPLSKETVSTSGGRNTLGSPVV